MKMKIVRAFAVLNTFVFGTFVFGTVVLSTVALSTLLMGFSSAVLAREAPVAKLVQVQGTVEYSRNGTDWRPVTNTKYLFEGYTIKTGKDGSGRLINQADGLTQDIGAASEVAVKADGIELIAGNLTKPEQDAGTIFEGLSNKFAKAQRYTTVRRSVTKTDDSQCDNKVRTISEVTLSASFPDLVWRNACPEYSYRVVINGVGHDVAAQSTSEMIRFTVTDAQPGVYTYHVEVLDKDGTVYIPRGESSFTWLEANAEKALMAKVNAAADDVFVATDILESQQMHVAAMDKYRQHFTDNPDDNDMRPLLIQNYQDLKLSNLRESEARLYNSALEENY